MFYSDTSSALPKPSRPGPSRQLQRWPEGRGGRMKRGNMFNAHKLLTSTYMVKMDSCDYGNNNCQMCAIFLIQYMHRMDKTVVIISTCLFYCTSWSYCRFIKHVVSSNRSSLFHSRFTTKMSFQMDWLDRNTIILGRTTLHIVLSVQFTFIQRF